MFHDRRRILINQGVPTVVLNTYSTSSDYLINVNNGGSTAIWEVSEGYTFPPTEYIGNAEPILDLSTNTGNAKITIKGFENLTALNSQNAGNLSSIDISEATDLTFLGVKGGALSVLDVSKNVNLTGIHAFNNNLTTLDISNNPLIIDLLIPINPLTSASLDDIIITLDNHGLSNGVLNIPLGRTLFSNTAYDSLIAKGWTITES